MHEFGQFFVRVGRSLEKLLLHKQLSILKILQMKYCFYACTYTLGKPKFHLWMILKVRKKRFSLRLGNMDEREHFPCNRLVPTKFRSFISKFGMDFSSG